MAQRSFELLRLHSFENLTELRPRFHSKRDQIITPHQRRRDDRLIREFLPFLLQKLIVIQHPVAALAIDAMQLELVLESRPRHEAFQFRHPHVRHVLEDHVLPHRFHRRVDLGSRKSEPLHDRLRHFRADAIVSVETNAALFIDDGSRRLADVVEEHAENQRQRNFWRQQLEHDPGMLEHVAFRMELWRLLAAFHCVDFRQNNFH